VDGIRADVVCPLRMSDKIILKRIPGGAVMEGCEHVVYHSPTGIEWGYGGSGPADCARSILLHFIEPLLAEGVYQVFKEDVLVSMPHAGGEISREQVDEWLVHRVRLVSDVLVRRISQLGLTLASAESCTGGSIGVALTSVPGCSHVFAGGIIAYTIDTKVKVLGLDRGQIERFGVVSKQVATHMASLARVKFCSDLAVATTGVAGPSGGEDAPVGTVDIAVRSSEKLEHHRFHFTGDREAVQAKATVAALRMVAGLLGDLG